MITKHEMSRFMKKTKKKLSLLFTGITLTLLVLGCTSQTSPVLQAQPDSPANTAPAEVSRIGVEESKAAFDSGEAIFLDVRSESSYAYNHIPGALSIPLAELEGRIDELDPEYWIITYCT